MEENVKNLCAPIPAGLHARVREEQEVSGKTLGQYMAWLIQTFYDNQKEETTMSGDKRTVAFQVPGERLLPGLHPQGPGGGPGGM